MLARGRVVVLMGLALVAALACGAPSTPAPGAASDKPAAPAGGAVSQGGAAPVAAPAAAAPQSAPGAPERLVVGYFPTSTSAVAHIAQERGYLAEQGIEVELVPFTALPEVVVLMNSGQVDLYVGGTGANLYNAVARGIQLRAVADKARTEPGAKSSALVVRRDLWESGEVRSFADLRGRAIATVGVSGAEQYGMTKLLQTVNLSLDDVGSKVMPPPDQLAGLGNKGLDAAYMFQAAVCAAERRNLGVALRPYLDDVAPGLHSGLTTYGDQFIRDKSRAARGFMVAYLKAVRDYTDAQRYGVDRAQIVEILQKAVPMQDPSYYDECEWGRINPDGYIDRKLIDEEILWSVQVGLIDRAVPADQFVDDQFVDYALQVIGRYQPKSP